MRGYFGIGAEGISKPMNVGNLARSAHAFGASFLFLVDPHHTIETAHADTSDAGRQVPLYRFDSVEALLLPRGCSLIGVELLDEAADLPSFRHPLNAAYVFGLSPDWRTEWGGLLLFHRAGGEVEGLTPAFNTLNLFAVPQLHSVSQVTRAAPMRRYSIPGWLRSE